MYLKPQNIKNLVQFNHEGLTPNVLIDNFLKRFIIFAILKNQLLDTHTSPVDAVIIVVKGKLKVSVECDDYELNENDIFIIPANLPHSVSGVEDSYFIVVRFG